MYNDAYMQHYSFGHIRCLVISRPVTLVVQSLVGRSFVVLSLVVQSFVIRAFVVQYAYRI